MIFDVIFEKDLFTIRRYGPGGKSPLGKPTRILLSETPADGLLDQTGTVEGEAFVVDKMRATMPIGTDLRADDEVEARGDLYTVEGRPFAVGVPGFVSIGVVTAVLQYVGPVTT